MTAWRLVPVRVGSHVLVGVFAGYDLDHLVRVGQLELTPDAYADLAARFGVDRDPFDPRTGNAEAVVAQPLRILDTPTVPGVELEPLSAFELFLAPASEVFPAPSYREPEAI